MVNLNGMWVIDQSHSEIQFKVKHLVISTVTGSFGSFDANMEITGGDFANAKINFSADINSISTNNDQRDGHLKSDDFFNAEIYPKMTFVSKSMSSNSNGTFTLLGDLTIRDNTKEISLNVEFGGVADDFYGNTKAGFSLEGKLNRKDFGLSWSAVTEAGGVVVSDEVKLIVNAQMTKTK